MKRIFIIICIISIPIFGQKGEWFPEGLNIQPFSANFLEPRAGFSYLMGRSEIRLDIGTSQDIYLRESGNASFSAGADLFTYTRLRGTEEFHFPVDAIDYLFGLNAGYKIKERDREYGMRFRLSHISAHLVDGSYETKIDGWREGRAPRVYSREFIEVFPFYRIDGFRAYAGLTYLFHVNPDIFGKGIYQLGMEKYFDSFISKNISPYIAYDFKLTKLNSYRGNNTITAGLKFGEHDSKGFTVYYTYYSGNSVHGEYFDLAENYSSFGFNLEL